MTLYEADPIRQTVAETIQARLTVLGYARREGQRRSNKAREALDTAEAELAILNTEWCQLQQALREMGVADADVA